MEVDHYRHARELWPTLWELPDDRPPWEWAEENVQVDETSMWGGFWKSEHTPWVREPMEDLADNNIDIIVIQACHQSGKSQWLVCAICWINSEDPDPMMIVSSTDNEVQYFMEERAIPTLEKCKAVVEKFGEKAIKKARLTIKTPTHKIYCAGAQSPKKLQQKSVRWLILDELREYPAGAADMAEKRTSTYWNSRILKASTAHLENDEIDIAFKEGNQCYTNVPCMSCGVYNELDWKNMKWGEKVFTDIGGIDEEALAPTIYYECPECGHRHKDTPIVRQHFKNNRKYIARNPKAPKYIKSYHWNSLLPTWISWKKLVIKYLNAVAQARIGNIQPLKDFINQELAQPWEDRLGAVGQKDLYHKAQKDYKLGSEWKVKKYRIITADKQASGGTHYWYVIRDWAMYGGESRLVAYGKAHTEDELIDIANEFKVSPKRRIVDCGYDYTRVLKFCHNNGWIPFRGDSPTHYIVRAKNSKTPIRQPYASSLEKVNFGLAGTNPLIQVVKWSNPTIKDMLAELSTGLIGNWSLPNDIDEEYITQFTAEVRIKQKDGKGKVISKWIKKHDDDHLRDCELEQLVAALHLGVLQIQPANPPSEDSAKQVEE